MCIINARIRLQKSGKPIDFVRISPKLSTICWQANAEDEPSYDLYSRPRDGWCLAVWMAKGETARMYKLQPVQTAGAPVRGKLMLPPNPI
jgi:hypothetical protein